MIYSIKLGNLLTEAIYGNLSIQLLFHTRHSVINDTNREFIPDWHEQMRNLDEELNNHNNDDKRNALKYLSDNSKGVYECYVNWIENSGIFENSDMFEIVC